MKTVYHIVTPVYLLQALQDVGSIKKDSFVPSPVGRKRNDAQFSDWISNNKLKRSDFRVVKGYVGNTPFAEIY